MSTKQNPANAPLELPKGYRPMSVGVRRLEVPDKLGWHRHWFRGTPSNIARAKQAGYTFVDPLDVDLNNFDLAGEDAPGGSTDLGTRVSVISGDDVGNDGQPGRLYLMECPEELYKYAQELLGKQVDRTAEALRGGRVGVGNDGETRVDSANRYIKEMKAPLLTKKQNG